MCHVALILSYNVYLYNIPQDYVSKIEDNCLVLYVHGVKVHKLVFTEVNNLEVEWDMHGQCMQWFLSSHSGSGLQVQFE